MAAPDAKAHRPGQNPERIDLRVSEQRRVLIDCSELLGNGELVQSATAALVNPGGVRVTDVSGRNGNCVAATVRTPAGEDIRAWRDFLMSIRFATTRDQTLTAAITLRVHKE